MRKESIAIKKVSHPRVDLQSFWSISWNEKVFSLNTLWLNTIEREHCTNTNSKAYKTNAETFAIVVGKLQNVETPGRELIVRY